MPDQKKFLTGTGFCEGVDAPARMAEIMATLRTIEAVDGLRTFSLNRVLTEMGFDSTECITLTAILQEAFFVAKYPEKNGMVFRWYVDEERDLAKLPQEYYDIIFRRYNEGQAAKNSARLNRQKLKEADDRITQLQDELATEISNARKRRSTASPAVSEEVDLLKARISQLLAENESLRASEGGLTTKLTADTVDDVKGLLQRMHDAAKAAKDAAQEANTIAEKLQVTNLQLADELDEQKAKTAALQAKLDKLERENSPENKAVQDLIGQFGGDYR